MNAGIEKVKLAAAQLTQIKADLTATIQALVLSMHAVSPNKRELTSFLSEWKQLQQQQVAISTMMSESSTEQVPGTCLPRSSSLLM